jgi:hypothetical protein
VTAFGSPTPACKGAIRLTALGEPKAGNSSFAIACVGAPPGAVGVLGVAGAAIYLDLSQPVLVLGALASALGYGEVSLPLPVGSAGALVFAQMAWIDTGGCGGAFTVSTSDALPIAVAGA